MYSFKDTRVFGGNKKILIDLNECLIFKILIFMISIDNNDARIENLESEIEVEDTGVEGNLNGPFDPNDIDVDISTVNLGSLLEQLEYDEIDLQPEFQRSSDVWTLVQKSRLIESILLGLPLPSFYFSEDSASNKLLIVDGLQRLCALKDFWIDKKLKLEGMQFLTSLEGLSFFDLDRTQIRRIKSLKVTLNILRKSTPTNVKFVIFQRVNTAGEPLKPQEMRNALYQGKATRLLKEMAEFDSFKRVTGGRVKEKRMADCDFINRFLAFYLRREKYNGELDAFLNDTLASINVMSETEINLIKQAFDNSMDVCYQLLGNTAFRRPNPDKPNQFLKINKAIFEVLSVTIAKLSHNDQQTLILKKLIFKELIYKLFTDEDFSKSVTSGTAKTPQVDYRFKYVNSVIEEVLYNDK